MKSLLLLGASVALLSACSTSRFQAPKVSTYPPAWQHRLEAAAHWDILAKEEAEKILAAVKDHTRPIYVESAGDGDSAFSLAYHEMLLEHLGDGGAILVTQPTTDAVRVSWTAQVLTYLNQDGRSPRPGSCVITPGNDLPCDNEVIITTRVIEGDLVVASDTQQFYFKSEDRSHYLSQLALNGTRAFKVVGQ